MKILVIGGTRFFGVHLVNALLEKGHSVTIATRGLAQDPFGGRVERIVMDHLDAQSVRDALSGRFFDVVYDQIMYCTNVLRHVMDAIHCSKFICMSSTAVYDPIHPDTREEDFDALAEPVEWHDRPERSYADGKRDVERALAQCYADRKWITVRYPYVIGEDDYTERLLFYVEHAVRGIPMRVDNMDRPMGFIRSDEAGQFLAHLAESDFCGAVNGCNGGAVSIGEILAYVEGKTGRRALVSDDGEAAPYNGQRAYTINTDRAEALGFRFTPLRSWIFKLIDHYIHTLDE